VEFSYHAFIQICHFISHSKTDKEKDRLLNLHLSLFIYFIFLFYLINIMVDLIYWPCTQGYLFGLINRRYKRKLAMYWFDQYPLKKKKRKKKKKLDKEIWFVQLLYNSNGWFKKKIVKFVLRIVQQSFLLYKCQQINTKNFPILANIISRFSTIIIGGSSR
jgi:hypothetical protein